MPYRDPSKKSAYNRRYRLEHQEERRQSNRAYQRAHRAELNRRSREYYATHAEKVNARTAKYNREHPLVVSLAKNRYEALHPERRKARNVLNSAIRYGKIRRPEECSRCGRKCKPEGHHFRGYAEKNWLVVTWLCRACHWKEH